MVPVRLFGVTQRHAMQQQQCGATTHHQLAPRQSSPWRGASCLCHPDMPINDDHRPWRGVLYGRRWRDARLVHLNRYPLCARCEAKGRVVPATVVHHTQPHRGDARVFWDRALWQSLCAPCHDSDAQSEERSEPDDRAEVDVRGVPTDGSW